jgi:nardilysin
LSILSSALITSHTDTHEKSVYMRLFLMITNKPTLSYQYRKKLWSPFDYKLDKILNDYISFIQIVIKCRTKMDQVEVLETPIKSEGDKKEYRLIKLKNGLKALLMKTHTDADKKDSDENRAAASLMVSIGSFHEPASVGGLAHFLEHMIFMGNGKYPDESGFNDFVSANGGRRNAMTSDEFTLYFFDIFEDSFPEALDRFANMFISPLLSKNAMQREREAVDSEYQMAISNEGARILSILKLLISESHPASQFDFGNLRTLKDEISNENLHAALLDFFKLYVANKMCLCVQSKRSLDDLQALVVEKFSTVPSESGLPYVMETTSFDFNRLVKPHFYEKIFYVKPKIAKKGLVMTWVLPQQISNNDCKPLNHVAKIFENSGEGGIASWLKEQNLTINFSMHSESEGVGFNHDFSIARLVMELTDHGLENIEIVLNAIFSYLLMLKEMPVEEHKRLFEQDQKSSEISFKYHQESSPSSNVRNYGTNFLYYSDQDILRTSLTPQFNERAITEVISQMNELRFNLLFLSDKRESFGKKELYFQTEYDELDFPESYKKLWQNRKLNEAFYLPKPNPFEASSYEMKVNEEESPVSLVKTIQGLLVKYVRNRFRGR